MREIKTNAIYRHFKGDYYFVIDVATNSETKEKYVVYRSLYDNCNLWIRPWKIPECNSKISVRITRDNKRC